MSEISKETIDKILPLPQLDPWLQRNKDLYWALRTRVLTDEEMEEVQKRGWQIAVEWVPVRHENLFGYMQPISYNEKDKIEEFNNALLNQFKMRLIKEQVEIKNNG